MNRLTIAELVGSTPLIYLKKLSALTGNHLFAKAEFMNPGGSIKDRTALGLIRYYEALGQLRPGMTIYEGTAGNTGIGLATLAPALGYQVSLTLPNNQSQEKYALLKALGAQLHLLTPVPFSNPMHFYHQAKALSQQDPQGLWLNQFECLGNYQIHFETTGPELWQQTNKILHFFGCAAGTGGSLAGISHFLKSQNSKINCTLFDPMGSGLYNHFKSNELKSQGQSVTEGIGIMRITENYKQAQIDNAYQITDQQMISMLYFLSANEGLFVGPSAALNIFGLYRWAIENMGQGLTGVTLACDSGTRYQSKILNSEWLQANQLVVSNLEALDFEAN